MTSQEPTGLEPWTPVKIRETSVTERAVFKGCRRRWLLNVVHRLDQVGINENFWIGELIHDALAAYYLYDLAECGHTARERCPHAAELLLAEYDRAAGRAVDEVREELGFLWDYAHEQWEELVTRGRLMLEGYLVYDRMEGGLGTVLHVEQRWSVPIPGTRGRLRLRIDLVADKHGRRRVVDHKNLAGTPSDDLLDIDDQFTGYFWGDHAATGEWADEVIRNVLLKKAPEPPRLIKKGKELSRDKSQRTTVDLYLAAIAENGFDRAEYEEFLSFLAAQGWESFFRRQVSYRSRASARQFGKHLATEWRDMARVASKPELAYPSPDQMRCGSCPVRTICQAMMNEDDVEGLIKAHYVVKEERE